MFRIAAASTATSVLSIPHRRRSRVASNEATLWGDGGGTSRIVSGTVLRGQLPPPFLFVPCHPFSTLMLCFHTAIRRTGRCQVVKEDLQRRRRPQVTKKIAADVSRLLVSYFTSD
jgi:hypothetical protein